MKVFAVYKCEMLIPYWVESLIQLYKHEDDAIKACQELNDNNTNPIEEDSYGPLNGCKYQVIHLDVK